MIFLADDLCWNDVGFHGSEIETPNLDRLAAAGVRLNQFYVQPVCSPTRSSLLTGRYPIRQALQVGVVRPWAQYGLPLDERTLPQALKEIDYRTAIVGKWHLGAHEPGHLPTRRGFDHQYGHYLGMIDYFTHERMGGLDWHRDDKVLCEEGYTTNLIAREAVRVVKGHDLSRPLLLYVAFNAPHTPLQAPQRYIERYGQIRGEKRRIFAAMVTCMDEAVGHVLAALGERGMRENTLVFFCSDNGGPVRNGANNDPLRAGKGTLYEGGVRVPAVMTWPGTLPAGKVVDEPLHMVDIYPTLLKLTGASLDQPLPLDGLDAWPTIAAGKPSPRTEILHNVEPRRGAVRRGDWKLIVTAQKDQVVFAPTLTGSARTTELFNIAEDRSEKTNLAERHPQKVEELMARLNDYAKQAVAPKGTYSGTRPPDFTIPKVWGESE